MRSHEGLVDGAPVEGHADGGRVGLLRRAGAALERALPPAENSRLTQIATTGPTYERARDLLRAEGVSPGPGVLDFGAGRGHGTAILEGHSFEPYPPAGFEPTYRMAGEIPPDAYSGVVNLNVLNVLQPEMRDEAVHHIGRVMQPGGLGVVTTRGRDVMAARGAAGPEPMSLIIGEGDAARYQKGFTPRELREYLEGRLGDAFDVDPLDMGAAGALLRRRYAVGGLVEDEGPSLEDGHGFAEGGRVGLIGRALAMMLRAAEGGGGGGRTRQERRAAQRLSAEQQAALPSLGEVEPWSLRGDDIRARRADAAERVQREYVGREFSSEALGDPPVRVPASFVGKVVGRAGDDILRGLGALPHLLRSGVEMGGPQPPDVLGDTAAAYRYLYGRTALSPEAERSLRATIRDQRGGERLLDDFGVLSGAPATGASTAERAARGGPALEGQARPAPYEGLVGREVNPRAGDWPDESWTGYAGGGLADELALPSPSTTSPATRRLAAFRALRGLEPAFRAGLERFVRERPIGVAAPEHAAESILREGQFRTQFETGTSGGLIGRDGSPSPLRVEAEQRVLGLPEDLPPEQRPVYGALRSARPEEELGVYGAPSERSWRGPAHYGDHLFLLGDDAKGRSTYTWSDSLGVGLPGQSGAMSRAYRFDEPVPSPADMALDMSMLGWDARRSPIRMVERLQDLHRMGATDDHGFTLRLWPEPYVETQTPGRVTTSDVSALLLPGWGGREDAIRGWASDRRIPVYRHDDVAEDRDLQRHLGLRAAGGGVGAGAAFEGMVGREDDGERYAEGGRVGLLQRGLGAAIRAFHGSPHRFDRFDFSRIGSGEGNATFGHGLYFAESEDTARAYRDQLSPRQEAERAAQEFLRRLQPYRGVRPLDPGEVSDWLRRDANSAAGGWNHPYRALSEDEDAVEALSGLLRSGQDFSPGAAYSDEAMDHLRRLQRATGRLSPGHMYEVRLGLSPDTLLRWDRRLDEQPGHVQEVVRGLGFEIGRMPSERQLYARARRYVDSDRFDSDWHEDIGIRSSLARALDRFNAGPEAFREFVDRNPTNFMVRQGLGEQVRRAATTGQDVYMELGRRPGRADRPSMNAGINPPAASEALLEAGVPGLRYLDAGSRGMGEGSHNIVTFSDEPVEIVRRYARGGLADAPGYAEGGAPGGRAGLITSGLAAAIRAFHGSPHRFDRFDFSRIGSGEGAQTYGHGLYFAENEDVARAYRDGLAFRGARFRGVPLEDLPAGSRDSDEGFVRYNFHGFGSRDEAMAQARYDVRRALAEGDRDYARDRLRVFNRMRDLGRELEVPPGHMYEVRLNVDPSSLLDWDRPLGSQPRVAEALGIPRLERSVSPDEVVSVMRRAREEGVPASQHPDFLALQERQAAADAARWDAIGLPPVPGRAPGDLRGSEFYGGLAGVRGGFAPGQAGAREASEFLRERGIPGLRYLDQGSRGTAGGTSNFVTFSDEPVEVVRRYAAGGLTGMPAAPAGGAPGPADELAAAQGAAERGLAQAQQMWAQAGQVLGGGMAPRPLA